MIRAAKGIRVRATTIYLMTGLSVLLLFSMLASNRMLSNSRSSADGSIETSRNISHTPSIDGLGELTEAPPPPPHRSLLTVVPGFGDVKRLPQLKETIDSLRQSAQSGGIDFSCLVYVWKDELLNLTTQEIEHCTVQSSHGMWTHHMLQAGLWYNESQQQQQQQQQDQQQQDQQQQDQHNPFTHVALLMDDVNVQSLNLTRFFDTMSRINFDLAAPSDNNKMTSGHVRPHCMAHLTGHVDILFAVFTPQAFECWISLIDTTTNPMGWGYDISVADLCRLRVGTIDHEFLTHIGSDASIGNGRQYSEAEAFQQMWTWLDMTQALRPNSALTRDQYYMYSTAYRPRELGYCHDVRFRIIPTASSSSSSLVTGLRRATVERGLFVPHIPSSVNSTPLPLHTIDFVDSVHEWFRTDLFSKVEYGTKWVGVLDYMVTTVPPPHVISTSRPHPWLQSPEFVSNAPNCVALFVYTSHTATMISNQLKGTLFAGQVAVCPVRHAIPSHHNLTATTAGQTSVMFEPDTDLKRVVKRQSSLVLWGFEPYNRVATLHQLRTKRKKIWLARLEDLPLTDVITDAELLMEGVPKDPLVQVMDTRRLSDKEYSQMLLRNIVVVDVWSEGTYAAALDAIAWRAPFFFRQLDGLVEYLGDDYPLFFKSLDKVQVLLDNSTLLEQELLHAHKYLEQLYQHNVSSNVWDDMARAMANCTLQSMTNWPYS